jgi:predicted xylose isomerase-like sugar epimerase
MTIGHHEFARRLHTTTSKLEKEVALDGVIEPLDYAEHQLRTAIQALAEAAGSRAYAAQFANDEINHLLRVDA